MLPAAVRRLLATAVLSLAAWVPAAAQFEGVKASIQKKLTEDGVPSLAVAVARGGKIIWEEGFGWADRAGRIPATEHTMYSLASISKPITATGLMVLVERGQVDLDKPINDYLGAAKINGRAFDASQATVRLVAGHRAGLPLHYQFFYEDEPYRRPPMDETIRRYANLVTAPGERYQYSNLGFGILDYLLSRVSGMSYTDFMRREVFLPLGMTHTSIDIAPELAQHAATRYAADGTPIPFYDFDHPGGSAVFSSAHDLIRFGMFHLGNKLREQKAILTAKSLEEMHRPAEAGAANGYGIGWGRGTNSKGLVTVSHTGGMGGVSTTLILIPELDAAVTVLCNASSAAPHQIAQEIIAVLAPGKVELPPVAAPGVALDAAGRRRYVGDYDLGETVLSITEGQGRLTASTSQGSSPLLYRGDDKFELEAAPGATIAFAWEQGVPVASFTMGGRTLSGRRGPPGPALKKMPEIEGTWIGDVDTYEGGKPIVVRVDPTGAVFVRLGEDPWTLLNDPNLRDGMLTGYFAGDIGTVDVNRRPYRLRLEVKHRGQVLNGGLIAQSLPDNRIGNALTHWVSLTKQ